jgi:UDP-N-acetylmuramoylalanine--D-glutamate ligase
MNIKEHKISILGAVRSGVSAAKLALAKGAIPFISDNSATEEVLANTKVLEDLGVLSEVGGHTSKVFDCNYIITSPGVPSNSKVLIEAKERNIKIYSEIEFASWFCEGSIIAITGTNGKTTTTTLCAHVLNSNGLNCYLAGNIGVPFSEIVQNVKKNEFVALEVSSFQLDYIDSFKPKYSMILNITPDHLDRYDNRFDLYIKSKMKIVFNQDRDDTFIFNGDDDNILLGYVSNETSLLPFSLEKNLINGSFLDEDWIVYSQNKDLLNICEITNLPIKGEHNIQNSLAVINVAINIGIDPTGIKEALKTFKGVEHRLEFVRQINGINIINDSKATNVDSVWYALRSFESPIFLILGGKDKGNDYSKIKDEVKRRVKKIYAIGSSAEKVYEYFKLMTKVEIVSSFQSAIEKGVSEAKEGNILLLSPACASFDMFKNYEDRGNQFKKIVNGI